MAVYKEEKTNTWRAVYRYTDWNGERKQTQKRGFKTKREAQAWEREQVHKTSADLDMNFKSFVELYTADMKTRLKENTWATKEHMLFVVTECEKEKVYSEGKIIHICCRDANDQAKIQRQFENWWRKQAKALLQERTEYWYPIIEKYGIPMPKVSVRKMKTL